MCGAINKPRVSWKYIPIVGIIPSSHKTDMKVLIYEDYNKSNKPVVALSSRC